MRVVAALGGNALLRRGDEPSVNGQRSNAERAAAALAEIATEHELVITHGNGPQIGMLALQSGRDSGTPDPLDVLGAESEGLIGYMIEQALENAVTGLPTATLLTQVVVDPDDPAFEHPTKPIGPVYDEATAHRLAAEHEWSIAPDEQWWRRVVASPEPLRTIEANAIEALLDAGITVVCSGGGGIPVAVAAGGALRGIEAVIDKDLSAALLAQELDADALLLLTDVDGIESGHGTPEARVIATSTPAGLRQLDLPAGSMGPKAEAAARFAEANGGHAAICSLDAAADALAGNAGTQVVAQVRFRAESHTSP